MIKILDFVTHPTVVKVGMSIVTAPITVPIGIIAIGIQGAGYGATMPALKAVSCINTSSTTLEKTKLIALAIFLTIISPITALAGMAAGAVIGVYWGPKELIVNNYYYAARDEKSNDFEIPYSHMDKKEKIICLLSAPIMVPVGFMAGGLCVAGSGLLLPVFKALVKAQEPCKISTKIGYIALAIFLTIISPITALAGMAAGAVLGVYWAPSWIAEAVDENTPCTIANIIKLALNQLA